MATSTVSLKTLRLSEQEQNLGDLLGDDKRRNYFSKLAHHISGLLHSNEAKLQRAAELKNVVYLIDADVVRNFVEGTFRELKLVREANQLFASVNFNYALPFGAFQELIIWLRSVLPGRIHWLESAFEVGTEDTARAIAHVLGVSFTESETDAQILKRIRASVEREAPIVRRLIEFVASPRFKGVIHEYEMEDVQKIYNLVRHAHRKGRHGSVPSAHADQPSRLEKDFRDAINLALVFERQRAWESTQSGRVYALITQTFAIRTLADFVREELEVEDEKILADLLGTEIPVMDGIFPVLSPRQAFIIERVRERSKFSQMLEQIADEREIYDKLSRSLRKPATSQDKILMDKELKSCLSGLAGVYEAEPLTREFSKEMVISSSVAYLEAKHRKDPAREDAKKLAEEVGALLAAMKTLHQEMDKITPVSYRVTKESDEDANGLTLFRIIGDPGVEVILSGELYERTDDLPSPEACVVRWKTACTEIQFFEAISSLLRTQRDRNRESRRSFKLLPLCTRDDEAWSEGLIVYARGSVYGCPLKEIPDLKRLRLESILVAFREGSDLSTDEADGVVINALRVTTSVGDFQLELLNPYGSDRYVSIMTRYNLSLAITHLCERTSLTGIFPHRLNKAIQSLTAKLPEAPTSTTSRREL